LSKFRALRFRMRHLRPRWATRSQSVTKLNYGSPRLGFARE
jgi:hypothetical protein